MLKKFVEWIKSKLPNYAPTLQQLENKWLELVKKTEVKVDNTAGNEVKYSRYNEFNTNAMIWANSADRKSGDVKILNCNGKGFVLIEADGEGGYTELIAGKISEVEEEYDRYISDTQNKLDEVAENIRAGKDGHFGNSIVSENGRRNSRNTQSSRSEGLQDNTARDAEYLRTGDKGKSIKQNTEKQASDEGAFSLPESGRRYSINKKSNNTFDKYSEEEYNNFGWVTANDVWTPAERETIFSRYADYLHNNDKYPVTRYGEAVINSSEHPDIIAYVKGNIKNPTVTKVIRIHADRSEDISIISERILHNEYEQIAFPYQVIEEYYGPEFLEYHYKRNYASFQEYRSGQERRYGEENNSADIKDEIGNGNLQSNKANDRADGLTPAFSMPENEKRYSIPSENVRHNQERYLKWLYKKWGLTKYSEDNLKADIKDLRHAVSLYNKGGKYREEAREIIERLAYKALNDYERIELTRDAKEIRKALRSYTFKLTDKQKQEAEYLYGSVLFLRYAYILYAYILYNK